MNKKTSVADLAELERPALEALLASRGVERFRARQIFRWIYRRGVPDVDAMTDLPRELRATLASDFALTTPGVVKRERAIDMWWSRLLRLSSAEVALENALQRP